MYIVKLVAVKIEEVKQQFPQTDFCTAPLSLALELQQVGDETDDRESTNAAAEDFIQAAHGQKLLDDDNELRHLWIVRLPLLKCWYGGQSAIVFEGDVDLDIRLLVDKLENRNFRLPDDDTGTRLYDALASKATKKLVSFVVGLTELWSATTHVLLRDRHQIHVSGGEI